MPQPWIVQKYEEDGYYRRMVERDFLFYDPPGRIWSLITRDAWDYKTNCGLYRLRDLAFMALLYWTCARVSELCRAKVYQTIDDERIYIGSFPSLKTNQFVQVDRNFINLRDLRIMKRRVRKLEDYPRRREIRLPLKGDLSVFTKPVVQYLERLGPEEEMFTFSAKRGFQIVSHATQKIGMPHYLREMGLKFRLRLYDKNIKTLQDFSGHARSDNLLRYLGELENEQDILDYKMEL